MGCFFGDFGSFRRLSKAFQKDLEDIQWVSEALQGCFEGFERSQVRYRRSKGVFGGISGRFSEFRTFFGV